MKLGVLELSFEQEDADIWEILAATASEAQLKLIKEALRQFLGLKIEPVTKTFNTELELQELFSGSDPGKASPEKALKPWEHLLNDVIGLEKDESVIAAIQALQSQSPVNLELELGAANSSASGLALAEAQTVEVPTVDVPSASPQQSRADQGSKGMAYLLQVIGEEEDEELAAFLRQV